MNTSHAVKKPPFKKHPLAIAVHFACGAMLGAMPLAHAGPTGGTVVGGAGSISQSGLNTTVTQASQNMAINWQSYNLQSNEKVQYIQPNSNSLSLNRILSNDGSTIAGRIDANGKVILVNPNGIFFTSSASLNVGSIIASGLDINPNDFMNGSLAFKAMDGTSGTVVNSGMINASLGGSVALLGKQVKNDGMIVANLGSVSLASGKQAVLTFDEGGLLGVRVTEAMLQQDIGVDPAVLNSGSIEAQGGKVLLTAATSRDVFSKAVNTTGAEPATSVVMNPDGSFSLVGGGDVVNSGSINTSATAAGQNGGQIALLGNNVTSSGTLKADAASGNGGEIELNSANMTLLTQNSLTSARSESTGIGGIVKVLGDKVGLFDQSTVDVSGANGGGQALIGGDFQGGNPSINNATATVVASGAAIHADALQSGNGGKVVVWADGVTKYFGNIFARGGAIFGDGGFVEVSGKQSLLFDGWADRSAVNGIGGTLLLDPDTITIRYCSSSCSTDVFSTPAPYTLAFADGVNDYVLNPNRVRDLLSSGDVVLQARSDITVSDPISGTTNTGTNDPRHTLTMQAGDDITISATLSLGKNNVTLIAGTAGSGCTGPACNAGVPHNLTIDAPIYTTGQVSLIAADSIFVYDVIGCNNTTNCTGLDLRPNAVDLKAGNNITIDGTGTGGRVGAILANGAVSITAANGNSSGQTKNPNGTVTGLINIYGNITTNNNDFTATTTAGYFNNLYIPNGGGSFSVSSFGINSGNGTVTISANGNDGTVYATPRAGALLGSITAGSIGVTTTTGRIYQSPVSGDPHLTITAASGTASFDAGSNAISLNNPGNSFVGTVNLTNSGANDATLSSNASTTTLGAVNVGGALTVTAANNLTLSGAMSVGGTATLNYGRLNGTTATNSTFTANTGLNLSAGGSGITVNGNASGSNSFVLNSLFNGTVNGNGTNDTLTGPAAAAGNQNNWTVTSSNGGTLNQTGTGTGADTPLAGTVNFAGIENLTGNTGDDLFTVNASIGNINTGAGAGTNTVNVNTGGVTGSIVTGSGTNTVNIDGTVASVNGATNNGTNNINVHAGGGVSGAITGGTGVDTIIIDAASAAPVLAAGSVGSINAGGGANQITVNGSVTGAISTGGGIDTFSIGGTVGGLIDGGGGSDTLNITTAGRTVKLGAVSGAADLFVDHIENINATGTGNTLIGHTNPAVETAWSISGANSGSVIYTSTGTTSTAFTNFDNLTGGTGDDRFSFGASGSISGILNGGAGAGTDTLVARQGVANVWSFTSTTSGSLATGSTTYVANFTDIENFTGGGTGVDWADFSGSAAGVNVNAASFTGFAGVIGNASSTLTGANGGTNNWSIQSVLDQNNVATEGLNDGIVNGGLRFINFGTLSGGNGVDNFVIASTGSFQGTINGNGGANTLTAKNEINTWNIQATGSTLSYTDTNGSIVTTFNGIGEVTGGSVRDLITLNSGVSVTRINAGDGNNDLTINGVVTGAVITGIGVDTIRINGTVGSVDAGAGTDTIQIGATGVVSGLISGGGDADTLDLTLRTAAISVQLGSTPAAVFNVSQVETINANGTYANTLVGDGTGSTWSVDGVNRGIVDGITFTGFHNLTGGGGVDAFTVLSGGSINNINTGDGTTNSVTVNAGGIVRGSITGGAGDDTFTIRGTVTGDLLGGAGNDYFDVAGSSIGGFIDGGTQSSSIGDRLYVGANQDVYLGTGVGLPGFRIVSDTIEGVASDNGRLHARDGYNTTWEISAENSGRAREGSGAWLSFSGFSDLFGSNPVSGVGGNDTFNIINNGSITGIITAGNGTNRLNVSLTAGRTAGQIYYIGGADTDSVEITGASNSVTYNTAIIGSTNTYDRLAYTGSTGTFNVNYTSASVESVLDSVVANTLSIYGTLQNDTISLGNNGTNSTFTVNSSRTVAFSGKTDLVVDGRTNILGFVGSDTINITGAFSDVGNNLTLRNANTITQTNTITANELVLDRIIAPPANLNTAVNSLSVINSGAVTVNQTGDVALNQITMSNPLTVLATGNITDTNTAQRNVTGAFNLSTTGNIILDDGSLNVIAGPISLTANSATVNNSMATSLAAVNASSLTVNSAGDITQTGAIVAQTATFSSPGGAITLNNTSNDFNSFNVTAAASVTMTDLSGTDATTPSIASGNIVADSVTLTTAHGIASLNTTTTHLTIDNQMAGDVMNITNTNTPGMGDATVSISTFGNIGDGINSNGLTNNGGLIVKKLFTNGASYAVPTQGAVSPYGTVSLTVNGGGIQAYTGADADAHTAEFKPDVTANVLNIRIANGTTIGNPNRRFSILVTDTFQYLGPPNGYIYYFGLTPPTVIGAEQLNTLGTANALPGQQLVEVESLGEFDPAIFTSIKNYYYEDVAILMPADQRLDATDEDEQGTSKTGATKKSQCEAQAGGADQEKGTDAAACDEQKEKKAKS